MDFRRSAPFAAALVALTCISFSNSHAATLPALYPPIFGCNDLSKTEKQMIDELKSQRAKSYKYRWRYGVLDWLMKRNNGTLLQGAFEDEDILEGLFHMMVVSDEKGVVNYLRDTLAGIYETFFEARMLRAQIDELKAAGKPISRALTKKEKRLLRYLAIHYKEYEIYMGFLKNAANGKYNKEFEKLYRAAKAAKEEGYTNTEVSPPSVQDGENQVIANGESEIATNADPKAKSQNWQVKGAAILKEVTPEKLLGKDAVEAFPLYRDYLDDMIGDEVAVNTRGTRASKLVPNPHAIPMKGEIRDLIDHHIDLEFFRLKRDVYKEMAVFLKSRLMVGKNLSQLGVSITEKLIPRVKFLNIEKAKAALKRLVQLFADADKLKSYNTAIYSATRIGSRGNDWVKAGYELLRVNGDTDDGLLFWFAMDSSKVREWNMVLEAARTAVPPNQVLVDKMTKVTETLGATGMASRVMTTQATRFRALKVLADLATIGVGGWLGTKYFIFDNSGDIEKEDPESNEEDKTDDTNPDADTEKKTDEDENKNDTENPTDSLNNASTFKPKAQPLSNAALAAAYRKKVAADRASFKISEAEKKHLRLIYPNGDPTVMSLSEQIELDEVVELFWYLKPEIEKEFERLQQSKGASKVNGAAKLTNPKAPARSTASGHK